MPGAPVGTVGPVIPVVPVGNVGVVGVVGTNPPVLTPNDPLIKLLFIRIEDFE
ncbi:hypothetical protein JCM19037_4336 [Geomicrobium sp. JCM 19037]|nr:hypothetical protein JCM19037_4336 [Geomicrobium sp. JCM 19037]